VPTVFRTSVFLVFILMRHKYYYFGMRVVDRRWQHSRVRLILLRCSLSCIKIGRIIIINREDCFQILFWAISVETISPKYISISALVFKLVTFETVSSAKLCMSFLFLHSS